MIKINNLYKSFRETKIYEGTDYEFKENKLTCFFGPSGSGKSTLFNLIAGFDTKYEGEIIVNENKLKELSLDELSQYRFNNIGFVFQNYNLLKGYSALENVLMGIHLNDKISIEDKREKAKALLISLGLELQINQSIETLSGGQKQRVAIARALINEPKIILADEPTGAVDEEATREIMEVLKSISKEKTVIVITHDEEVAEYADEIIEIEDYGIVIKKDEGEREKIAIRSDVQKEITKKPKLNNEISRKLSLKNFKIHLLQFILAALIIALGSAAFVGSLATKKITDNLISDFKEKNFAYNIGQAPLFYEGKKVNEDMEKIFKYLEAHKDIENVYYQYDLEEVKLISGEKELNIPIKVPTAIAKETMAYGEMPRPGKKEIVISSNVANRLVDDVKSIIGREIKLQFKSSSENLEEIKLKVTGLSNSQYQDFTLDSATEKEVYEKADINKENPTAVSFVVKEFEKISAIDKELKENKIGVFTKAQEVDAFQESFTSLIKLYTIISVLILIVGLAVSGIILYEISVERYSEVNEVIGTMNSFYFMIFIFVFILIISISFIYSKAMTKLLVDMSKIAQKISQCDFQYKYKVTREDEIGILGSSLNSISDNLEKSLKDLQCSNEKLKEEMKIQRYQEEKRANS